MKATKTILGLLVCTGAILTLSSIGVLSNNMEDKIKLIDNQSNDLDIFTIRFNKSSNKPSVFSNGEYSILTKGKNTLVMAVHNIEEFNEGFLNILPGGSFYNIYKYPFKDHNRISGIKDIFIVFEGELKLAYGFDKDLIDDRYKVNNQLLVSNKPYTFNDERPSYFKLYNDSNSLINITSIILTYTCVLNNA